MRVRHLCFEFLGFITPFLSSEPEAPPFSRKIFSRAALAVSSLYLCFHDHVYSNGIACVRQVYLSRSEISPVSRLEMRAIYERQ
jgi:hypothetical protein